MYANLSEQVYTRLSKTLDNSGLKSMSELVSIILSDWIRLHGDRDLFLKTSENATDKARLNYAKEKLIPVVDLTNNSEHRYLIPLAPPERKAVVEIYAKAEGYECVTEFLKDHIESEIDDYIFETLEEYLKHVALDGKGFAKDWKHSAISPEEVRKAIDDLRRIKKQKLLAEHPELFRRLDPSEK